MWIFCQKGFLSIVRHSTKTGVLILRSRFPGHIQTIFPKAVVEEGVGTDYKYRAELSSKEVAKTISRMVSRIDYNNFKDSLDFDDEQYLNCCLDVYNSVAKHSIGLDFDNFLFSKEETDEKKQAKG